MSQNWNFQSEGRGGERRGGEGRGGSKPKNPPLERYGYFHINIKPAISPCSC